MYSIFDQFNKNKLAYDLSPFCLNISECDDSLRQCIAKQANPRSINLGTPEEPQELQIGTSLSEEEASELINLFTEFKDVFTWSYKDMPGIDRSIAEHRIPIKPGYKPVK